MPELPTTFGKYFLTEKLATGGMAEIYLAKIVGPGGFEKPLVIKQIHPRLTGQRHFVDLFVAEAKTLVTLAHGNIVPVYELGVIDDTYFIAMEYIDGPTLYRLTEMLAKRGARMEPPLAAWIAAKLLEGLDYAHHKDVIHRDLSPRNVMLSRDGEVKLVDFGIAVAIGDDGERDDGTAPPTGSFPYMSPEQVRREALTGKTDVFSVGVLLWEMLAGSRLFARADADATLAAVTGADIARPSSVHGDIPAKLDEVAMRALERDASARYATAGEMLAALNRYLYALDETPSPRDVAALVARYCPPETRRLPTHADPDVPDDAATNLAPPATPPRAGPSTVVAPRGRRARTETFATNIDLEQMLGAPRPDVPIARPAPAPLPVPGRRPPSQAGLVLAGIGATALALGSVYVFVRGRSSVNAPDAAYHEYLDAPFYTLDPSERYGLQAPHLDAAEAPLDASTAPTLDAPRPSPTPDAAPLSPHPRPDAAPASPDAARPAGRATLKIGAIPWGDVSIDGAPRGRTPNDFVVDAGHHTIDISYAGEDPPRRQTFRIDVATGETRELQADFTKP